MKIFKLLSETLCLKMRHFVNPYHDYDGVSTDVVDKSKVKRLIENFVSKLLHNRNYSDGDLYVGTAGIAFMFLKLHQSQVVDSLNSSAISSAKIYIDNAKSYIRGKTGDSAAFLCGDAGIYSVSSIIHQCQGDSQTAASDLKKFLTGFKACKKSVFNHYGCDEILFGRAGYLSGIYWLNQNLPDSQRVPTEMVNEIVEVTILTGIQYSQSHKLSIPLMWECYGDQYLGAAHGISAILHMILESPLFAAGQNLQQLNRTQKLVKDSIDAFLRMQTADGNFPAVLDDAQKSEHKLVHWCHGAPGAVYLFAKAFLVFKDQKYLNSCLQCGELVWNKGLLRKGPGICHGVAGSGYVFLLLYRLTNDRKHLHRAAKFAEFLTTEEFQNEARTPDRPFSLYEGTAGTVCFLIDLLQPEKASFPFMDVFDVKF